MESCRSARQSTPYGDPGIVVSRDEAATTTATAQRTATDSMDERSVKQSVTAAW